MARGNFGGRDVAERFARDRTDSCSAAVLRGPGSPTGSNRIEVALLGNRHSRMVAAHRGPFGAAQIWVQSTISLVCSTGEIEV